MQGLKGFSGNIASGFATLYNTTLSLDILLLQKDNKLFDLLWLTYSNTAVLSIIAVWLLIYYYMWLPINWVKDFSDNGYNYVTNAPKKGKTKRDLVEEVRKRRHLGDLPPVYPNGWFALMESVDLKAGQVKHVQALGENFAVMRTDEGQIYVLDAYCPHLGANMAVGGVVRGDCLECPFHSWQIRGNDGTCSHIPYSDKGKREVYVLDAYCPHLGANMAVGGVVRGDCLECPFHGWQFRGDDGTCSHIPYSEKVPKSAVVKKWISKEANDFVYVWYHAKGHPPSWQIQSIPEIESGKLWYRGRCELLANSHIQDVLENLADKIHFEAIHKASVMGGSDIMSCNQKIYSFLTHDWTLNWKKHSTPGESHMSSSYLTHSLRIFGHSTSLSKGMTLTQAGPGTGVLKSDWGYAVMTTTPVEPLMIRMVLRAYFRPPQFIFGGIVLFGILTSIERDIMVWNHKKYVMQPLLTKEEKGIAGMRRWFSQFYTENSPKYSFQQRSLEW